MRVQKILSSRALAPVLAARKRKGETIVFTNGCFDLIHVGHITVLQKARALGDCLVVGLNSDASMRGLKGPGRPLVKQADRAKVMAALACVDYVTIFNEPTPEQLIRKLAPDILVKGGDYKLAEIVGRQYVRKVVRVPLLKGHSTSELIRKVIRAYGRR